MKENKWCNRHGCLKSKCACTNPQPSNPALLGREGNYKFSPIVVAMHKLEAAGVKEIKIEDSEADLRSLANNDDEKAFEEKEAAFMFGCEGNEDFNTGAQMGYYHGWKDALSHARKAAPSQPDTEKLRQEMISILGNPWKGYEEMNIKTLNGEMKVLAYISRADGRKSISLDDALLMRGMEQHGKGKCEPADTRLSVLRDVKAEWDRNDGYLFDIWLEKQINAAEIARAEEKEKSEKERGE